MLETERMTYPSDLVRAAERPAAGVMESTARELLDSLECYGRRNPMALALWTLGIGFVLGWKLKPW